MASEHYLLLCHEERLGQDNLSHLIELMRSQAFIDRIEHLPGYEPDSPGTITTFEQLLAGTG